MKKSLLDIISPEQQYDFSSYKSESYEMLKHLLKIACEHEQSLREKSVSSGIDEEGNPFIRFDSEETISKLQKYDAEIKYLEHLIRIRRIWHPCDWFFFTWSFFDLHKICTDNCGK